jgi:hypothetical protein
MFVVVNIGIRIHQSITKCLLQNTNKKNDQNYNNTQIKTNNDKNTLVTDNPNDDDDDSCQCLTTFPCRHSTSVRVVADILKLFRHVVEIVKNKSSSPHQTSQMFRVLNDRILSSV